MSPFVTFDQHVSGFFFISIVLVRNPECQLSRRDANNGAEATLINEGRLPRLSVLEIQTMTMLRSCDNAQTELYGVRKSSC